MSKAQMTKEQLANKHNTANHDIQHYIATNHTQIKGEKIRQNITATNKSFTENTEITFRMKGGDADFLDDSSIVLDIAPLSKTGGNFVRLVNAGATKVFHKLEVFYNASQLAKIESQELYQFFYLSHEDNYFDSIVKSQLGIGTETERNTLGTAKQQLVIPLRCFKFLFSKKFPLFMLEDELEFKFTYVNSFANIMETDGTEPQLTINNVYLDTQYVRNRSVANYCRKMKVHNFIGLSTHRIQPILDSGKTEYIEKVDMLKDRHISFITLALVGNSNIAKNDTVYKKIDKYALKDSGTFLSNKNIDIDDSTFKKVLLYSMNPLNIKNLHNDNLYIIPYNSDMSQELYHNNSVHYDSWSQHLTSSKLFTESNITLELKFDSNLGSNDRLYVIGFELTHYTISNGSLQRLI